MRYWMLLLSALTGGLSLFSVLQKLFNFGLAPLMQEFLSYYRGLFHPAVEVVVGIANWIASIWIIDVAVKAIVSLWNFLVSVTYVPLMQLVLPVAWFEWVSSTNRWMIEAIFGMSPPVYKDLFVLSFLLTLPLFRALNTLESDKLVPDVKLEYVVFSIVVSLLVSLPLSGLVVAVVVLAMGAFEDLDLLLAYVFQVGLTIAAAAVFYVLNAQL